MTLELWSGFVTIALVWAVTVLSPGPNFLATVGASLGQSRRAGLWVAFGIAVGTTIWAAASLAGLALLFERFGWLYHAVRLAGAGYLVFIGLRTLLGLRRNALPAGGAVAPVAGLRAFRRGLLTDLANPKAAAFFTSLFAVAVPPTAPLWYDLSVVALTVVLAGGWYALAACLVTTGPVAALYRRGQRAVTAAAGVLFVALGLKLAADR